MDDSFSGLSSFDAGEHSEMEDYLAKESEDDQTQVDGEEAHQGEADSEPALENIQQAHDALIKLNQELLLKSKELAERHTRVIEKEQELLRREVEIDSMQTEMRVRCAKEEDLIKSRLVEILDEERALKADNSLFRRRIKEEALEEVDILRDRLLQEKTKLEFQIDSLEQKLGDKTRRHKVMQQKYAAEAKKYKVAAARVIDLEARIETCTQENETLRADLMNNKKKLRVQAWKSIKKNEKCAKSKKTIEVKNDAGTLDTDQKKLMMLLVDGLAELALIHRSGAEKPVDDTIEVYTHRILPGLGKALELNQTLGSVESCSRLLKLCIYSFSAIKGHISSPQLDGLVNRLVNKFISKLVQENGNRCAVLKSSNIEIRTLASISVLYAYELKRGSDPVSLTAPLETIALDIQSDRCQRQILENPKALEPILHILLFCKYPGWQVCVRDCVAILLNLSRKGPLQAQFFDIVTRAENFKESCCAVLGCLLDLNRQKNSPSNQSLGEHIYEAASVVTVFLQRLTQTGSGVARVRKLFSNVDLVGMLSECQLVAASILASIEDKESLEFFSLNTGVILET
eukprot:CAMPEP_0203752426 /NCGR_PEP_ID=MMETSP0098-20131031/6363_1 /ASSEMBLY_ACC=CAM_ASM_000208 /TAXON_ID=96639 /ORGANISM=" , Strain NY0313808BC1" /LENGTH=573 /DNA_ID=CAMNT_0050642595 /DNA_START=60 /DNA_END=1778 /DNA_ORIENTATION=-